MRAAVNTVYGSPDVVHVVDIDTPTPRRDELLVRVRATTVNRTDCGFRAASPPVVRLFSGLRRPRRTVLGNEFAGEVVELGASVSGWQVGERVFGYVEGPFGAHAEYLAVKADASIARTPSSLGDEEAAPGTEGSHYALAFIERAGIEEGDRVLVNGATGAIGSAAVQLLSHRGVSVTAVCAGANAELVTGLGAEEVIDYTTVDFTRAAGAGRFDAVLDTVGKSSFRRCRGLLTPHGRYLSSELGRFAQNPVLALATVPLPGRSVRFPLPRHDQQMIQHLAELMASGAFVPVIDRRYPLEEIVAAYRYVETGQKLGNVVITTGGT